MGQPAGSNTAGKTVPYISGTAGLIAAAPAWTVSRWIAMGRGPTVLSGLLKHSKLSYPHCRSSWKLCRWNDGGEENAPVYYGPTGRSEAGIWTEYSTDTGFRAVSGWTDRNAVIFCAKFCACSVGQSRRGECDAGEAYGGLLSCRQRRKFRNAAGGIGDAKAEAGALRKKARLSNCGIL